MVCFDTPISRPTSAALRPASSCFSAPIISTSLYFLLLMLPPPHKMRKSYTLVRGKWGAGHHHLQLQKTPGGFPALCLSRHTCLDFAFPAAPLPEDCSPFAAMLVPCSLQSRLPNFTFHSPRAIFTDSGRVLMSVNKVILVGRLGRDPETRFTGGGQAVANFSVATDDTYKDKAGDRQKRTEWHKIVLWGKQAEIAQQYLKKGSQIFLEGRIQSREWQDKEGQKRTSFEIVANNFRMLGSRAESAAAGSGGGATSRSSGDDSESHAAPADDSYGGGGGGAPSSGPEISDEDIPF